MNLQDAYNALTGHKALSFVVDINGDICTWKQYIKYLDDLVENFPVSVIPGSFNPLHKGHKDIRSDLSSTPEMILFEISVTRFDKPPVSFSELESRLKQFKNYAPVLITDAARFIEKIGVLVPESPNLTFHIGIDTLVRMESDYGLTGIQGLNAKFVVNSRIIDGKLQTLNTEYGARAPCNCSINPAKRTLDSLSISSTQIRKTRV